jgi:GNAT superfamily N-acetyltransferase
MTTIQLAVERDLPEIARLHILSWKTAYRGFVPDHVLDGRSVEGSLQGWRNTFESYPENLWIAQHTNGNVVGICCAGPVVNLERSGPYRFEIYGLHVDPAIHRQGVGSLLIRRQFERALAEDLPDVIVWTLENLRQSRRFYEKHGGQVVKTGVWRAGDHQQNEVAYGWSEVTAGRLLSPPQGPI